MDPFNLFSSSTTVVWASLFILSMVFIIRMIRGKVNSRVSYDHQEVRVNFVHNKSGPCVGKERYAAPTMVRQHPVTKCWEICKNHPMHLAEYEDESSLYWMPITPQRVKEIFEKNRNNKVADVEMESSQEMAMCV